jgi:hypothetical protein
MKKSKAGFRVHKTEGPPQAGTILLLRFTIRKTSRGRAKRFFEQRGTLFSESAGYG